MYRNYTFRYARIIKVLRSIAHQVRKENVTLKRHRYVPQAFPPRKQGNNMSRNRTGEQQRLDEARVQWEKLFQDRAIYDFRRHQTREGMMIPPERIRNNDPVGDVLTKKKEDVFRVYFQNVNGLKLDSMGGDFSEACYVAAEVQADVLGIAESNIDFTKFHVRTTCYDAIKKILSRSKLTVSDTPIQTKGTYKPGGTMLLSQGSILGRLVDSGKDEMGRWSYQKFAGRNNIIVTVIAAYQVCQKNVSHKGRYTAAAQQESLLRQRNESDTNPRRHFRQDISKFLSRCLQESNEVLLMGDFNESLSEVSSGMAKICQDHGLLDLFNVYQGITDLPTYSRGKKRLDYALGTERVAASIKFGGYESFNSRMSSDHRAFFLDMDAKVLFGAGTPTLPNSAHRDINSKAPKQVSHYIRDLHNSMTLREVFRRARTLASSETRNDALAESLDRDMERLRRSAGKKCAIRYEPVWSLKIATARARVSFLLRALSAQRTCLDPREQLAKLQSDFGSVGILPDTVKECQSELRKAQAELRELAKEAAAHRSEEQLKRISELELRGKKEDRKTLTILRNIRKAEETAKMFSKIRSQRESNGKAGVSRLEVPAVDGENPKTCTNWKTVDLPQEVMDHLRQRNRTHFGQAQGTPFTVPPLSHDIDFTASTMATELVLEGEYDGGDLSETTRLLIKHMRQCEFVNRKPSTATISDEEFTSKLKLWKESTTTSPSGLHLGHWKALVARHELTDTDTPECDELDTKQEEIRAVCLALINYALKWGYSFDRWKTIVNIMIFKEPGNLKIHRLRVIHIYEADYNLILGVKWRSMIHGAEDANALNDGQYGGRPNRNALDPVFMEEMTREISRASRKSIVTFQNDAASCYDRILAAIAAIVSRKYGVSKSVTLVMAKTLEEAKYKLKTMLGVSEEFYQHCDMFPIYGTGQGSGNSPAIWCVISSVLFDAHEEKAFGATYQSPDRTHGIQMAMVGFVDDSTGQVNAFSDDVQPPIQVLLDRMQHDAQLWNDLLWTSGGALELQKCSYQVMQWKFTTSGEPVLAAGMVGDPLLLVSGDRSLVQAIPLTSAYTAYKTLGHFKSPSGTSCRQYQELKKKSDKLASFLQCSSLDHKETWTFYFAIFLPSIGYPLANSFLTQPQCDKIQRNAFRTMVSMCGFNRNTARVILYGPAFLGGACFRHLYTEQGVGQISLFLRHWRQRTQGGTLLRIAVAWTQYAIGTGRSFLVDTDTLLPHMEVKWLGSLRRYLSTTGGQLQVDAHGILPLQREYDCYIMDAVISSRRFTASQIRAVNYCRLFLQAVTLSDIVLPDGVSLDHSMLDGRPSLMSSKSSLHHFTQDRPPASAWRQWTRANYLWADHNGNLHQKLGRWLSCPQQLRRRWFAYHSAEENSLYIATGTDSYDLYWVSSDRTIGSPVNATELPRCAVPVSVTNPLDSYQWQLGKTYHGLVEQPVLAPARSFLEFVSSLNPWEASLMEHVVLFDDPYILIDVLKRQSPYAASDGSVRYETEGAFGWSMSLRDGRRIAKCSGAVYGYRPSSYRAEGYGLLSVLRFLIRLKEFCGYGGHTQHCYLASDNLSLVGNVEGLLRQDASTTSGAPWMAPDTDFEFALGDMTAPKTTMQSEWDVLNEISFSITEFASSMTIEHVRGHQDRKMAYKDLSLLAQLNVDADKYAGEFQDLYGAERPEVLMFPHNGVHLNLFGGTVTYNIKSSIRRAETEEPLYDHIQRRNKFSDQDMSNIDWEAHRTAIGRRLGARVTTIKLIHELLPTNSVVSRYQADRSAKCPCCAWMSEDRDHIIRCPHVTRAEWRAKCVQSIRKTCDYIDTRPMLMDILLDGMSNWFDGGDVLEPNLYPPQYHRLINQQNNVGWRQLFSGRMSREWSRLQDDHLCVSKLAGKTRTGRLWTTTIITAVWKQWDIVWKLRNGVIHGQDSTSRAIILRQKAEWQIKTIYDNRELYLPKDQEILFDTVEEHLTLPTMSLLNWYNTYFPMFAHSARQAQKNAVNGVRSIRSYFHRLETEDGNPG